MLTYSYLKQKLSTIVPLLLILISPPTVFLFWYTNTSLEGSLNRLGDLIVQNGLLSTIYTIWKPVFFGSSTAWTLIIVFAVLQLVFMKFLPGSLIQGPVTPKGNIPIYKENGLLSYFLTLFLFCFCSFQLKLFSPTIIYDNFGAILGALNIFSFFFCLCLYLKGSFFPSTTDSGRSGNSIFDFYWGTELYPRIFGWDVKTFTNCRFGMMCWGLIILSFAAKQHELYGLSDSIAVSVALQLIYITKFFVWETGYYRSLDIMHDRAGFYICWGCLVWVPGIYTSTSLYLVHHPHHLGAVFSILLFICGTLAILINYWADRQKQIVRATNGLCSIWGKKPLLTHTEYRTESGERKSNILLASGWWGISRHFHYVPEIIGALCWSLPALFLNFIPYFYVIFLTMVLLERAFRDDRRCAEKYGHGWNEYCRQVPYKIVPYVI